MRVLVRSTDGGPIANARLWLESLPEPTPDIAGLTDAEGIATVSAPMGLSFVAAAAADGYEVARLRVQLSMENDSNEIRLELVRRPQN